MADRPPLALVLHGAVEAGAGPDEQDQLTQAAAVAEALGTLGFRTLQVPFGPDLAEAAGRLAALEPELVFNLVESVRGSGRLIHLAPALVEALGLPLAGCDARAVLTTSDKVLAKRLMVAGGVPTPPWPDPLREPEPSGRGGERYIVKPVWEDASVGLDPTSVIAGLEAARGLVAERARALGGEWFAELYVEGRELNVSLLDGPDGPEVLPVAEMRFDGFPEDRPRIVDYEAKWHTGSFADLHTTRSFELGAEDRALVARVERIALRCWDLFGLGGYGRVDLRVDRAGEPFVLEVNANPCIAPDSGFVAAAGRAGLRFVDVVARIAGPTRGHRAGPGSPAGRTVASSCSRDGPNRR